MKEFRFSKSDFVERKLAELECLLLDFSKSSIKQSVIIHFPDGLSIQATISISSSPNNNPTGPFYEFKATVESIRSAKVRFSFVNSHDIFILSKSNPPATLYSQDGKLLWAFPRGKILHFSRLHRYFKWETPPSIFSGLLELIKILNTFSQGPVSKVLSNRPISYCSQRKVIKILNRVKREIIFHRNRTISWMVNMIQLSELELLKHSCNEPWNQSVIEIYQRTASSIVGLARSGGEIITPREQYACRRF